MSDLAYTSMLAYDELSNSEDRMNESDTSDPKKAMIPTHPTPERPEKLSRHVVEALRSEFLSLVNGNLDDNLTQIEQLASRTRELFLTLKGGEARLLSRQLSPVTPSYGPNVAGAWSSTGLSTGGGAASSGNVEQFGALTIRALVDSGPEVAARIAEAITNSPARQVEAIAAARKNGLDDVADKLEQRLLTASPSTRATSAGDADVHAKSVPTPMANGTQSNGSAVVSAEG